MRFPTPPEQAVSRRTISAEVLPVCRPACSTKYGLAANVRFSCLRSANSGLYLLHNKVDDRCDFPLRSRREVVLKKFS